MQEAGGVGGGRLDGAVPALMERDICEYCGFGRTKTEVSKHRSVVHGDKLFRTYLATNGRCPMCERDLGHPDARARHIGTYLDGGSCPDSKRDPRKWEVEPGERPKEMICLVCGCEV